LLRLGPLSLAYSDFYQLSALCLGDLFANISLFKESYNFIPAPLSHESGIENINTKNSSISLQFYVGFYSNLYFIAIKRYSLYIPIINLQGYYFCKNYRCWTYSEYVLI